MNDTPLENNSGEGTALAVPKKIDAVGAHFYGGRFTRYMRLSEVNELIPAYKDFYYENRIKDMKLGMLDSLRRFNTEIAYPQGKEFHPYTNQVRRWISKWNADILAQKLGMREDEAISPEKEIRQIVKVRTEDRGMVAPTDSDLEAGTRTLGGELLNDAMTMLRDDQELEEGIDDEILIKRRNYVLNVFAHATRLVHGKAALLLKASEEKRNNTSFMMTLLAKATAGKLTDEEMGLLQNVYSPKPNVPQQPDQL